MNNTEAQNNRQLDKTNRDFKIAVVFTIFAIIFCLVFSSVYFFILHNTILALLHFFAGIIVIINLFVLQKTRNVTLAGDTILFIGVIVVISLFVVGGWENTGFFWAFVYIPYALFLTRAHARFWIVMLFCCFACSLLFSFLGIVSLPYTSVFLFNYFFCLIFFTSCMVYFHSLTLANEQLLQKTIEESRIVNQQLDQVNAMHKSSEERLQKNTEELENSKKAIINVMEDLQTDKEKIDEQKHILDSILANLPIGITLSDASGKPLMRNQAGVTMLGRGLDPQVNKDNLAQSYQISRADGSLYPNEDLPLTMALNSGLPISKDDLIIQRPDGTKHSLRATSVPIKNSEGQVTSAVTVFEDITHDKEIDRMKTEFISLASHQLRTPLSAIKWFSEMLLGGDAGELNSEQKDFTNNISQSTERMIQLVNSLLNISRIESGRILVDPRPTDLKELVQDVVTDLKAKIQERKQTLIISVRDDLPKVNLDPRLIRQVYLNLLTNAIKYTPKEGEITVLISKKGDEIISQVNDNGYGIPKSQQDRIFQKFFRAENVVKVETDGTGLGLYLIKAIVESSKGKIWFESEEGKGTTFWFSLPMTGMEAKKGEVTLD